MAQWVKALAARSEEWSSTPGTHMVGDNSLPLKGFSFLVLLSNSSVQSYVISELK